MCRTDRNEIGAEGAPRNDSKDDVVLWRFVLPKMCGNRSHTKPVSARRTGLPLMVRPPESRGTHARPSQNGGARLFRRAAAPPPTSFAVGKQGKQGKLPTPDDDSHPHD